jgi:TldD protein
VRGRRNRGRAVEGHLWSIRVSEFDAAEAAVQAATDAGARYADARVMHRRHTSMSARDGEVEAVSDAADSGIGVRALVGSGWGFFAVGPRCRVRRAERKLPRSRHWYPRVAWGVGLVPSVAVTGAGRVNA